MPRTGDLQFTICQQGARHAQTFCGLADANLVKLIVPGDAKPQRLTLRPGYTQGFAQIQQTSFHRRDRAQPDQSRRRVRRMGPVPAIVPQAGQWCDVGRIGIAYVYGGIHAADPPTVSPPIISVGWPTPTGTH